MSRFRALPYARALHEVVERTDRARAEEMVAELDRVAEAITAVPQLKRVLVTPMVPTAKKSEILDQVLDALAVGGLCRRFVHVVQQHYRMEQMPSIAASYRELVDRSLGRARARIEVAEALDERQQRRVLDVLDRLTGRQVVADFATRPDLLAGVRIQVGSKVFDGSLVAQLERLSRETLNRYA